MVDPKPSARRSSEKFKRVRDARRTETAEDYVELIADLTEEKGEARVVDLSERLGVTKATVSNTIQRLQRDGFVTSQPYRAIFLTKKGRTLAQRSHERHHVVRQFLIALGVDAKIADVDAEGIEHHVSDPTLEAFRKHLVRAGRSR